MKTYPLADRAYTLGRDHRAVLTGEKRAPKKGEWYLSGAIPEAYRAPNDLSTAYHILALVKVRRVRTADRWEVTA